MTYIPTSSPLDVSVENGQLVVVDHLQQDVKEGGVYFCSREVSTLSNNDTHWVYIHSNGSAESDFMWELATDGKTEISLFEGGTVSTSGFELTLWNSNRNSTSAPSTKVFGSATVATTGTRIFEKFLPGGEKKNVVGQNTPLPEMVLKEDTIYFVRITNESGGSEGVSYLFTFHD